MEKGVVVPRGFRLLVYALILAIVGAWLFTPGSNATSILREWLAALWAMLHATRLGPYLPSTDLSLSNNSLLTMTSAAVFPRIAMIAWRSWAFVRRRKKAFLARARALAA